MSLSRQFFIATTFGAALAGANPLHMCRGALLAAYERAVDFQDDLKTTLGLTQEGQKVYMNGIILAANDSSKPGGTSPLFVMADYVGGSHRFLEDIIYDKGVERFDEYLWAGELELTLENGKVVITAVNSSSGFISETRADELAKGLVKNIDDQHFYDFFNQHYPGFLKPGVKIPPFDKANQHLMKLTVGSAERSLDFDPKHSDPEENRIAARVLMGKTPENGEPFAPAKVQAAVDQLFATHTFEFVDNLLNHIYIADSDRAAWDANVARYRTLKSAALQIHDYRPHNAPALALYGNLKTWAELNKIFAAFTKRARSNPDARHVLLSPP